jgi:homoserine kinase
MSLPDTVTVRVPGTIANMGPGFDSFGMAVTLYNEFTFSPAAEDALILNEDEQRPEWLAMAQSVKERAHDHLLWLAFDEVYRACGQVRPPLGVSIRAEVPMSRGLGSSSTAIVAALMAANRWLGDPLSREALLKLAIQLEHHPDNVAPALLGGVILWDTHPYPLTWPPDWQVLALSPAYPISTNQARTLLPQQVPLANAVFNLRKASLLTYALLQGDSDALRHALEDKLHQPTRSQLIPEYKALRDCALTHGAYGFIVSGSGPTMACFYPAALEQSLMLALCEALCHFEQPITLLELSVDRNGAVIV